MAVPVPKVRDERLCWLAVEDRLRRRSQRLGILGWFAVLGTAGLAIFAGRNRSGVRMQEYSVAVDHVAGFLDDAERATLRRSGTVPDWFVYEVRRVGRAVKRGRPLPAAREEPGVRRRRRAVRYRRFLGLVLTGLALVAGPAIWMRVGSAGRIGTPAAPTADVAIVFGAQVATGGTAPMPFLQGRLDTAAQLLRDDKAKVLLISGDRRGSSGDEVAVMHDYLVAAGVDPARLVVDPYGLDTYDTCRRARDVYGVTHALLVSQALHLPRAVTLCRHMGIDAHGVAARCDGCRGVTLALNRAREFAAGPKAAWEAMIDRSAAVTSPPDPSVRIAAGR